MDRDRSKIIEIIAFQASTERIEGNKGGCISLKVTLVARKVHMHADLIRDLNFFSEGCQIALNAVTRITFAGMVNI